MQSLPSAATLMDETLDRIHPIKKKFLNAYDFDQIIRELRRRVSQTYYTFRDKHVQQRKNHVVSNIQVRSAALDTTLLSPITKL